MRSDAPFPPRARVAGHLATAVLVAAGLLVVSPVLASGDAFREALRAYREGRFDEALAAFAKADRAAGEAVPAELLYDKALAALRAGDLAEAEASAERAAARGGARFEALRDFLRGNVAFAHMEAAEQEAKLPGAPPFILDFAIAQAKSAAELWTSAAASRDAWPEARRNVERALLRLAELERRKREGQAEPKKEPPPKPPEPAMPPPRGREPDPEPRVEPQLEELSPEDLVRLFEKLEAKEREKLAVRRRQARERPGVERDW